MLDLEVREIPVFPLTGVVLFPGAILPLHIFEPRYRQMLKDAIAGSKRFGVLNVSKDSGKVAQVGCVAEICEVSPLPDGRSDIMTIGENRFRVVKYLRQQPYYLASVEPLSDAPDSGMSLQMATKVRGLLKQFFRLYGKVYKRDIELLDSIPQEPEKLSYWVASTFPDLPSEQQSMLELTDTAARLDREAAIVEAICRRLSALSSIEEVFSGKK
jgi:ATP-dependent Lon protease